MKGLRDRGIYELPDGQIYAARNAGHGRYFLYLYKDGVSDIPRYLLTQGGRIQAWITDEWSKTDLVDTGKTIDLQMDSHDTDVFE